MAFPLIFSALSVVAASVNDGIAHAFVVPPAISSCATRSLPPVPMTAGVNVRKHPQLRMTIDQIDLSESISDDHHAEGSRMAASITGWLDVEWCQQEVHVKMADSAKASYVAARQDGEHDIMTILHRVALDLEADWHLYDSDAFVNAWDIGNYVADYLTQRAGEETCQCSATIFQPEEV